MRRPEPVDSPGRFDPADLRMRRMALADLDPVMAIEARAFRHPWSAELFRRELEHDWSTILLAELDTHPPRIAGFVIYWLVHDELHILNVATDPDLRRRGIAKRVLVEAISRAKAAGARLATLEVRRSNVGAILLYESLGFRSVGVRPNYYADEGEDAIVMLHDIP